MNYKYTVLFIILSLFLYSHSVAQNSNGLTKAQITEMQKTSIDVVDNYYELLGLISMQSADRNNVSDVKQFKIGVIEYFENDKVDVLNNLIEGGSKKMNIRLYLNTISTIFSLSPGKIESNNSNASTVYQGDGFYIVKVSSLVKISGKNTDNNIVNSLEQLDTYLKFEINGKSYNSPKIYGIIKSQDESKKLKPVEVIQSNYMTSNSEETIKLKKQLAESKKLQETQKAELLRIQSEWNKKQQKLNSKEENITIKEKEIQDAKKLVISIMDINKKKQDEIDNQKREIEHKEKELSQVRKSIENDKENLYSMRLVMDFGMGAYFNSRTIEDRFNNVNNITFDVSPQINAMIGYRFDLNIGNNIKSKINRGNVFGAFVTYGLNSTDFIESTITDQNLNISNDRQEKIYNRTLDAEIGFIFRELFRLSGGVGSMNGYRYNIVTTSLQIPISKKFIWGIGSSYLFGQDFRTPQIRPYTTFSIQFNDKPASRKLKGKDLKGRFYVQFTPELVYNIFSSSNSKLAFNQLISTQSNLFAGVRLGVKSSLGIYGTIGNNNNFVTHEVLNMVDTSSYIINNAYNPYYNLSLGFNAWGLMRISYGYGKYTFSNDVVDIPYQSFTIGGSINIIPKKDVLRFNVDFSTKIIDNSLNSIIFGISSGISLRFNAGR